MAAVVALRLIEPFLESWMDPDPRSWVMEYDSQRYLRKASYFQLRQRLDHLAANSWMADDAGNVRPANPGNRVHLAKLMTHTLMEQRLRRGKGSVSFYEDAVRTTASYGFKSPQLDKPFVRPSRCISKFGKKRWIREAYENGRLKASPASTFDDPSLNPAQRDDELTHLSRTPNRHVMMDMRMLDLAGNEIEAPYEPIEYFEGFRLPDFYVWCCAYGYHARVFGEFGYDAVLVIKDVDEIRRRFVSAMEGLLIDAEPVDGKVTYYDPYTVAPEQLTPIFSKNFRYLYQNEFRFAWKVPEGSPMRDMFPSLGPLKDIADYYELV